MRRLVFLLPVVVFAGLTAFFYKGLFLDPSRVPNALEGQPRPDFVLPNLDEGSPDFSASDLDGELAVVNFFASWCGPCRVEHPVLMRLAESGLAKVYGITYKDKPEDSRAWLDEVGDPFVAIGVDVDGRAGIDFGVYGVPETYFINPEGVILHKEIGPMTAKRLNNVVLPFLEKLNQ